MVRTRSQSQSVQWLAKLERTRTANVSEWCRTQDDVKYHTEMCASCIFLLLILVFCALKMGADGLPVYRRERGVHQDIIAGADFLSVLMESPALRQAYKELSTTELPSVTRLSRSTPTLGHYEYSQFATSSFIGSTDQQLSSVPSKFNTTDKEALISINNQLPEFDAITQKALQNLEPYIIEVTTPRDQNVVVDTHPSVIADATQSEFSVEEMEPITYSQYVPKYSSKVDALRNGNHEVTQSQSIIYHQNPVHSDSGRSVSYTTVIQSLPKHAPITWNEDNQPQHHGERKERHYDINNTSNENKLENESNKYKNRQSFSWEKAEQPYTSTEKNWESPEKNHNAPVKSSTSRPKNMQHFPIIYGKPEENYEVDEAVSVMSRGRVHGVQALNKNDNQKVGYVVEGRNYKKYRVEERTSDGFIVGEYGVVSHDDGSLRGVRYTADGTINPRIVYDALMKFLSL